LLWSAVGVVSPDPFLRPRRIASRLARAYLQQTCSKRYPHVHDGDLVVHERAPRVHDAPIRVFTIARNAHSRRTSWRPYAQYMLRTAVPGR